MNKEEQERLLNKCDQITKEMIDIIDESGDCTLALTVMIDLINMMVMTYEDHKGIHDRIMNAMQMLYERRKDDDQN